MRTELLPNFSEQLLLRKSGQVLRLLRIASWRLPAGLRGGGATEHLFLA